MEKDNTFLRAEVEKLKSIIEPLHLDWSPVGMAGCMAGSPSTSTPVSKKKSKHFLINMLFARKGFQFIFIP